MVDNIQNETLTFKSFCCVTSFNESLNTKQKKAQMLRFRGDKIMKDIKQLVKEPIFFERNRVYRIYKGGMPYKNIFNDGYDDGTDNMFPEEWVASKVKAINPKYFGERDGVSVIKDTNIVKRAS